MVVSRTTRISEHVARLADEHPPIPMDSVDFTIRDAPRVRRRFGVTICFLTRVELEVARNVRELDVVLPHAPPADVVFYRDVWGPQELAHGAILDHLVGRLGLPSPTPVDVTVAPRLRALGVLDRVRHIEDVARMLYYLTGVTTERLAQLVYHSLGEQLVADDERAIAMTAVEPIRRQEPGHLAFYRMSAEHLSDQLRPWQRWLVRELRQATYSPPGVTTPDRSADLGRMMGELGLAAQVPAESEFLTALTQRLLRDEGRGLPVPDYVRRGFEDALARATAQPVDRPQAMPSA